MLVNVIYMLAFIGGLGVVTAVVWIGFVAWDVLSSIPPEPSQCKGCGTMMSGPCCNVCSGNAVRECD